MLHTLNNIRWPRKLTIRREPMRTNALYFALHKRIERAFGGSRPLHRKVDNVTKVTNAQKMRVLTDIYYTYPMNSLEYNRVLAELVLAWAEILYESVPYRAYHKLFVICHHRWTNIA